ncbi:hypothetical protein U9M48_015942 [Paspalum notatum var. saurae]|uniref:Bifunctional inhibitor/plant lipid transfer protein/seed storage helical domain-containing protein n=1 Tax=Paspalum notatum var. saurae TaxID=547442 RepID=A0AAQ3WM90_PASNO
MARRGLITLAAVAVAVLALASGAASQAPAPGPSAADCGAAVTGLVGCLPYVQQGSTQSKPPKDCCAGVKAALKSPDTVACLCNAFGQDYGFPINLTRAAGLPAECGENPAALSKCNIKVPSAAPGSAPPPSGAAPGSSGSPNSAATRSPVSAFAVLATVAAPLLSYYYYYL